MSALNTNAHRAIGDRGPQRSYAVVGRAEAQVARWSKAPAFAILLLNASALLAIAALTMHSCTAMRSTPLVNQQSQITNQQFRIDSVYHYEKDSTSFSYHPFGVPPYLADVSQNLRVDTVFIERWHTRFKDHETVKTDTLKVTEYQTITETQQYIPRFYKWCTLFFWMLIILFLGYLIFRIMKAVYLHK